MQTEGNSYVLQELQKLLSNTTFQLKKYGNLKANVSIQVDYSPYIFIQNKIQQTSTIMKSIPVFNTDRRFFTPSFIQEIDKKKYNQNEFFYKTAFQSKIRQIKQEKTQMFLPKPSQINSFCSICRVNFTDYLQHINNPLHNVLSKMSDFQKDILNICKIFQVPKLNVKPIKKKSQKVIKSKQIKKSQKPRKSNKLQLIKSCSTITDCPNSPLDSIKFQ